MIIGRVIIVDDVLSPASRNVSFSSFLSYCFSQALWPLFFIIAPCSLQRKHKPPASSSHESAVELREAFLISFDQITL